MQNDRSFVWYQINEAYHFLSPAVAFAQVDQPFWHRVHESGVIAIKLTLMDTRKNIFAYAPFTSPDTESNGIPFTRAEERASIIGELSAIEQARRACTFLRVQFQEDIARRFAGRQVLLGEVHKAIANSTYTLTTLQSLYLQGFFDWGSPIGIASTQAGTSGILGETIEFEVFCNRCGNGAWRQVEPNPIKRWIISYREEKLVPVVCSNCGGERCYYCPKCLQLGLAKSCEPYLIWSSYTEARTKPVAYHWRGELSQAQQAASDELVHFVHGDPLLEDGVVSDEYLVWAVCGAGKTEIIFQTIYQALEKNQKVLLTCPRRDVIVELAPRLREAFPETKIAVLHGESEDKYTDGELFLATTHQVLRFRSYFDLVIVDEEDAFPFMTLYIRFLKRSVEYNLIIFYTFYIGIKEFSFSRNNFFVWGK